MIGGPASKPLGHHTPHGSSSIPYMYNVLGHSSNPVLPLSVSPSEVMSSFMLSNYCTLGLSLFLSTSNLECCGAMPGILSAGILSTCTNHWSLLLMTMSTRVVWVLTACLMSSFLFSAVFKHLLSYATKSILL